MQRQTLSIVVTFSCSKSISGCIYPNKKISKKLHPRRAATKSVISFDEEEEGKEEDEEQIENSSAWSHPSKTTAATSKKLEPK